MTLTVTDLQAMRDRGELKGIVDNVPIEVYHASPGVSSSGLKALLQSPAHFRAYQSAESDSAALRFGRLVHTKVLEPELWEKTVILATPWQFDGRTKEGKAERAAFAAKAEGREVVDHDDAKLIYGISDSIASNTLASRVLSGGAAEVTVYWTDAVTGLLCKARADYLTASTIFDLKTTFDARLRPFQRSVTDYRYHLSAAFYLDGFSTVAPRDAFAWLAVEKKPPFAVGFYAADPTMIEVGRREYRRALELYALCLETNHWPAYEQTFQNLTLPPWYVDSTLEGSMS